MARPHALVLVLLPFLPLVAAAAYMAVACTDDWCPAFRLEMAAALSVSLAWVTIVWLLLSRRTSAGRAALVAWSSLAAAALLVGGLSQVNEKDFLPATFLLVAALALGAVAWLGARARPVPPAPDVPL